VGTYRYLIASLLKAPGRRHYTCPNCGAAGAAVVRRKYLVTQLRRCAGCGLLFRTPTDSAADNEIFYNRFYRQGTTTDTPAEDELAAQIESGFSGFQYSYERHIRLLRGCGVGPGARVFDFGCSWGYGPFQLARHGYKVTAFEIGRGRADFARHRLGVDVIGSREALLDFAELHAGAFDAFFSSHVLEHVPQPGEAIAIAERLLRPGGLFISLTPNGSAAAQRAQPNWEKWWGEVHPNFIDDVYLNTALARWPRTLFASPLSDADLGRLMPSKSAPQVIGPLDTLELGCVAVRP